MPGQEIEGGDQHPLGLLAPDPDRIRPTPFGQRFLNDLLALFEPGGDT